MLELQKFIYEHKENWKDLLIKEPYNIIIREDENFIIFNYNQIESCFDIPLVLECRGIVLEKETYRVVCFPFIKFWNLGESRAAKIDWSSARVTQKIDGSIIKLWNHKGQWYVSTMGVINAKNSGLGIECQYRTFYELFEIAIKKTSLNLDSLNKDYTYIFELVSPFNKVVIYYNDIDIYHIGTRDNVTLKELDIEIGIKKPDSFSFNSMDDLMEIARKLPFNFEGYVVCDKNYNRVKVKSPAYVAVHHLKNNGVITPERLLELILLNEHEEFLSYYMEFEAPLRKVQERVETYLNKIRRDIESVKGREFKDKKEYAMVVKNMTNSNIMFQLFDGRLDSNNWVGYIMSIPANKLIKMI